MDDKERLAILENALAQMLKPVKGVPLSVIIKSLSDRKVIKFDHTHPDDARVLSLLEKAIRICAKEVKDKPIRRPRPNEVGNDIEEYVMRGVQTVGLKGTSKNTMKAA